MPKNKQILMVVLVLTIATLAVYWRVTQFDFTNYDDPYYITENSQVQKGITLEGIPWAFTSNAAANWHPLTWLSHMLDIELFGLRPGCHHFENLLFHIANALLLFFVLHRMTSALWESAFVAALFALHPLHVESVAWVAERKDVLSTFFWILTMGVYCSYVEQPGQRRYLLVLVFFILGLMTKPMLVTLPFVLLLLDYWPLRRFQQATSNEEIRNKAGDGQKGGSGKKGQWKLILPLVWEKVPFFVLSAMSSVVTYIFQQQMGAVESYDTMALSFRISNALVSYIAYIGMTLWPTDLAVLYPIPETLPAWQILGSAFLLMAITTAVVWKARSAPYLAMGWLWYVGTLVPVIGIVQAGLQARADRYTYVPHIGLFIMAAWGVSELSKKWRYRKEALIISSAVVLLCLGVVTWNQVRYWQDGFTLFDHALQITKKNYIAHFGRGAVHARLGRYKKAIEDFDKALALYPRYAEARYNHGAAYLHLGDYRQAVADYSKAIEINPKYAEAYYNRAYAYYRLGDNKYDREIAEDLQKAARLGYADAQKTLKEKGIGW